MEPDKASVEGKSMETICTPAKMRTTATASTTPPKQPSRAHLPPERQILPPERRRRAITPPRFAVPWQWNCGEGGSEKQGGETPPMRARFLVRYRSSSLPGADRMERSPHGRAAFPWFRSNFPGRQHLMPAGPLRALRLTTAGGAYLVTPAYQGSHPILAVLDSNSTTFHAWPWWVE